MKLHTVFTLGAILLAPLSSPAWGQASSVSVGAPSTVKPLIDLSSAEIVQQFKTSGASSSQVNIAHSTQGVDVTVQPGTAQYPGFEYRPAGGNLDLSSYGHIELKVTNTGAKPVSISLRIDNKETERGPAGSNTESLAVKPGQTGLLTLYFGYSFGKNPGFALRSSEITNILIFSGKSPEQQSYRIESVVAAGATGEAPPVNPNTVQIRPKDGYILGGAEPVEAKQIEVVNVAQASLEGKALKVAFQPSPKPQAIRLKPPIGRWNLTESLEVHVKIKNTGSTPANPRVVLTSNGGDTADGRLAAPLAPGAEGQIVVTFLPQVTTKVTDDPETGRPAAQQGTGTKFTSNTVSVVKILPGSPEAGENFLVQSIRATAPAPSVLPEWVGKRPPVEGDWVQTFNEDFNGTALDETKWNLAASNFWDKRSHFSRDNVIIEGGVAKLRFEKKTGFHNDDPAQKKTDYATGFLDTYGKWVQRYGYFEARIKPTKAPGMWPAFWLMPDRGVQAGPQWKRADTANGGMEFDIWEYLGRWGQHRYNVALHWDGYGKNHKATGCIAYTPLDKDGYITSGLLWTPGLAVIYANGKEVFRYESPRVCNVESDIMFTAVSGGWDNDPIDDSKLPDDLVIDYVRAWQRKDLASSVDGPKTPVPASAEAPAK